MQSFLALLVVCGAIVMLFLLGGDLGMFADFYSGIYLILMMYSGTVIAFGSHGFIKSITGLSYLFAQDISHSPATEYLAIIYKKQISFLYGGALIGFLVGLIAINSNVDNITDKFGLQAAYAVCTLVLLYAAIISEGILRPLSTKLEHRSLASKFQ